MKRIIAGAAIAAALFVAPASAQNMNAPSAGAPPPPARVLTIPATPGPAIGVGQVGQPTYVVPAPTVSVGTLAGEVLAWVIAAFGSVLATVFTAWGVRLFKLAGVQIGDAARARLQEIILNGLNAGAKEAEKNLAGKDPVTIKNAVVAQAVAYAQAHGADTIKALGLDPQSGEAVEAIKARIQTAIADPAVPTPAVLDPTPAAPKTS